MTANELRIGNFVLPISGHTEADLPSTLIFLKVLSVDYMGNVATIMEGLDILTSTLYTYKIKDLSAIPLTFDILESAGFEKWEGYSLTFEKILEKGVLQVNLSGFTCFIGGHESCVSGMGFINQIKYLHQLQNLYFDLTGQELEIKSNSPTLPQNF